MAGQHIFSFLFVFGRPFKKEENSSLKTLLPTYYLKERLHFDIYL